MTEKEVIAKLLKFKDAIVTLKGRIDEKDQKLESFKGMTLKTIKHLVEDNIEPKEEEISNLKKELAEQSGILEHTKNSLIAALADSDKIKKDFEDKVYTESDLYKKVDEALKSVEDEFKDYKSPEELALIINSHKEELDSIKSEFEACKKEKEDSDKKLAELLEKYKNYISIDEHQSKIESILAEKKKADDEKQIVLSNTWKTQVETSQELKTKNIELENKVKELETVQSDFDLYKSRSEEKISELTLENRKQVENTQLEMSRLQENVKNLTSVKEELENTNKELLDKIKRLEDSKNASIAPERKLTEVDALKNSEISREMVAFRFGRTSYEILHKVVQFINGLFSNSQDTGAYFELNNPVTVKKELGLTDKQYEVFMERLQRLKINDNPLIYEFEGRYRATISKSRMIDFISEIIN